MSLQLEAAITAKVDCPMCHGEGVLEHVDSSNLGGSQESSHQLERSEPCSLCRGCGSVDAPTHENTFNTSPLYFQVKGERLAKRSSTNAFIVAYLSDSVDELKRAA